MRLSQVLQSHILVQQTVASKVPCDEHRWIACIHGSPYRVVVVCAPKLVLEEVTRESVKKGK